MNLRRRVSYNGFSKKDYSGSTHFPVCVLAAACVLSDSFKLTLLPFSALAVTFQLFNRKHCFHIKGLGGVVLCKIVFLLTNVADLFNSVASVETSYYFRKICACTLKY